MENLDVSIIVPIYNGEMYLEECIKSILNQSFNDFELLLIDDGSTDSSPKICNRYVQKDSRIRYFRLKNGGVSVARNFGLSKAKGKYVCFIDCDDVLCNNYLQLMVASILNYDFVVCGYEKSFKNYCKKNLFKNKFCQDNIVNYLIENKEIGGFVWNKIYKLDILKMNNLTFKNDINYNEDTIFNLEYTKFVKSIAYIDEVLYSYRMRKNAASYNMFHKKNSSILLAEEFFIEFVKQNCDKNNLYLINKIKFMYLKSYYNFKNNISENIVINKDILFEEREILKEVTLASRVKFYIIKYLNVIFKLTFKINLIINHYYE